MILRTLGQTDLRITPIGIGGWAIGGGKWEFAWGPQDDTESVAAIHAGLDRGINWIDTAAVYGLGHSETVVGRAVRQQKLAEADNDRNVVLQAVDDVGRRNRVWHVHFLLQRV